MSKLHNDADAKIYTKSIYVLYWERILIQQSVGTDVSSRVGIINLRWGPWYNQLQSTEYKSESGWWIKTKSGSQIIIRIRFVNQSQNYVPFVNQNQVGESKSKLGSWIRIRLANQKQNLMWWDQQCTSLKFSLFCVASR